MPHEFESTTISEHIEFLKKKRGGFDAFSVLFKKILPLSSLEYIKNSYEGLSQNFCDPTNFMPIYKTPNEMRLILPFTFIMLKTSEEFNNIDLLGEYEDYKELFIEFVISLKLKLISSNSQIINESEPIFNFIKELYSILGVEMQFLEASKSSDESLEYLKLNSGKSLEHLKLNSDKSLEYLELNPKISCNKIISKTEFLFNHLNFKNADQTNSYKIDFNKLEFILRPSETSVFNGKLERFIDHRRMRQKLYFNKKAVDSGEFVNLDSLIFLSNIASCPSIVKRCFVPTGNEGEDPQGTFFLENYISTLRSIVFEIFQVHLRCDLMRKLDLQFITDMHKLLYRLESLIIYKKHIRDEDQLNDLIIELQNEDNNNNIYSALREAVNTSHKVKKSDGVYIYERQPKQQEFSLSKEDRLPAWKEF